MITARQFLDTVELFSATIAESDYGKEIITYASQGSYPASVEVMAGFRSLNYYQEGMGNPLQVIIRKVDFSVRKVIWDGATIYPRSIVTIDENRRSDPRGRFQMITGSFLLEDQLSPTTTIAVTTTQAGV